MGDRGGEAGGHSWQDRDIRFDLSVPLLEPRRGEFLIDTLDSVEDSKGNAGERGELTMTNLRLIWCAQANRRTNISIGYNCFVSLAIRTASSRLKGTTQVLNLLTKFNGSRFEFIFTNLVRAHPRLFDILQVVYRAYDTSRLYRELKLRGALIVDGELRLLPLEQTYSTLNGVWNLSSDQGNLGFLVVTNVRLVWYANMAQNFNVSIPYLEIKTVRIRDSKFGPALVVETTHRSGGYILGFRVDPKERMEEAFKEIESLWRVFSVNPIFGIEYSLEDRPSSFTASSTSQPADDVDVIRRDVQTADVFSAYYAVGTRENDKPPVFCRELGLAIEPCPEGVTVEQLWSVA